DGKKMEDGEPARMPAVAIRTLLPGDRTALVEMTRDCGIFRSDEIAIAEELLRDAERDGTGGHYQVLVADVEGIAVGWLCYGRTPLTDATFDLYWIVVTVPMQGRGIGRELLREVEQRVRTSGGRWLLAETSTTDSYRRTQQFYLRGGYRMLNEIED